MTDTATPAREVELVSKALRSALPIAFAGPPPLSAGTSQNPLRRAKRRRTATPAASARRARARRCATARAWPADRLDRRSKDDRKQSIPEQKAPLAHDHTGVEERVDRVQGTGEDPGPLMRRGNVAIHQVA